MDKYNNQLCSDSFSQKLDLINLLVNKCSHNLSSNLLTTSILSRDLMGLTTDIFDYDSRADQINNDSRNLKQFLDKLELLSLKMQFVESQIDALEQHQAATKKNKRHSMLSGSTSNSPIFSNHHYSSNSCNNNRINHMRLSSVNSMKDQFLDLKTTEDTLQNVYQEFFHLKKIYLQMQSKEYLFEEDDEEEDVNNDFDIELEKCNNLEQNTHNHQLSVSTAYTSLYDESQNLKPIKCTLKSRKRMSGLHSGSLYVNSGNNKSHYSNNSISSSSKSYNISQFSNDLFDNIQIDSKFTIVNSKRKSYTDTISENQMKPAIASTYNKPEDGSGLGIFQENSVAPGVNNLDDVNFGFQFPKNVAFIDAKKESNSNAEVLYKNQFNDVDFRKQTMNWLSQFSISKNNTNLDNDVEPISSITPLSPSNNFHPSMDITKSSQALLLDMMCKVKEKERNLEREITQRKMEAAAENFLQLFSKNFSNGFQLYTSKNSTTVSTEPDDTGEIDVNNVSTDESHDEVIDSSEDYYVSDVTSKYIYPISRVFSSFFEGHDDRESESIPVKVDPILENGVIDTAELNDALQTKLTIS